MSSFLDLQAQTIANVKEFEKSHAGKVAVLENDIIDINEEAISLSEHVSVFFKDDPITKDKLQSDIKRISKATTGRTVRKTHGMEQKAPEDLI
ncbi:hypothetical protein NST66_11195 [Priestia sp. FSL W8-0524]|uniref:hypothetical protein n=1 Tax=Priestia sp. FSL W8-0524 TaxID=2954625 RepID=UPI0030FA7C71